MEFLPGGRSLPKGEHFDPFLFSFNLDVDLLRRRPLWKPLIVDEAIPEIHLDTLKQCHFLHNYEKNHNSFYYNQLDYAKYKFE